MTRQQLRLKIYNELGVASGNNLATAGYINAKIDQGQKMIALLTRWSLATATTAATASQAEYTVPSPRMFFIKFVEFNSRRIGEATEEDLYQCDEGWRTRYGTVEKFYQPAATRIGLYPMPTAGSGATIKFWGFDTPTGVTAGADTGTELVTPLSHQEALLYFVCREAMERLADTDPNGVRKARFEERFNEHQPPETLGDHHGGGNQPPPHARTLGRGPMRGVQESSP
jgi:hypothetical protein